MKLVKYGVCMLFAVVLSLQAECEECKKLRDEITKSWKVNIDLTKEVRALTTELLKHSDTIRKLHNS